MNLPQTTHLQFQVLGILMCGEQSGQYIRDKLREQRIKKSGPGFYQLMARLEDAKLIQGRYERHVIDGQPFKERRYKLLAPGIRAWENTRDFYLEQSRLVAQKGTVYV